MKILKSVFVVLAMVAMITGATNAIFSSTASVNSNTFATGSLEIRIDEAVSIPGFSVENAAPGIVQSGQFVINNYGQPHFTGSSTLPAKSLKISAVGTGVTPDSTYLYNNLDVIVKSTVGWNETTVFTGKLKDLVNKEILLPGNQLATGWSM
ncbi:MAG: TasA family protein, partial [Candidatus Berkelbacteria bacterium]|nr:TasA family protein [Candidatus Berkelbacteria bacterium]